MTPARAAAVAGRGAGGEDGDAAATGGAGPGVRTGARTGPSALEIARALAQPEPTPEQQAVIEAPLQPLLVVAGAGSGKTETMASRVVYLVAGGQVRPEEVLGLTFTRKAAAELSERVRRRLRMLRSTGLWSPGQWSPGQDGDAPATTAGADETGELAGGEVTVSTYHSFAGRIVREHGLRLGIEPESRLLSQAAAWQLAAEVVERWAGEMNSVDAAVSTVTAAVLDLAGECAEHLVPVAAIDDWLAERITVLDALPYGGNGSGASASQRGKQRAAVRDLVRRLQGRRQILPIVSAFQQAKRERDSVDFGDQVAFAARLAQTVPALVAAERSGAKAVLLDEYQDTSHAQLEMLHALFGDGHGVTAVGDPHQSIYGWRGASAGTLLRFAGRFRDEQGRPATELSLSTSWRNDHAVLAAANTVAAPLNEHSRVAVRRLTARPDAGPGQVLVRSYETVEQEAAGIADHLGALWWKNGVRTDVTAAVLCRKRSQFEIVEAALSARGLPVEVVGLGGLLTTPEVTDVLAALHVVHDPSRGDRLMRLLTGAQVQLGPRDLVALGSWSRELHRQRTHRPDRRAASGSHGSGGADTGTDGADGTDAVPPGEGHPQVVVLADVVDESSLVEALDELPGPHWADADGRTLSATARQRLQQLAGTVRGLRGRTALSLPELVVETERALLLDIEVASRPGVRPAVARAHLDALAQVAGDFAATADHPTLGAFLAWLDAAAERERGLEPGEVEIDTDAVQLMTIHAAKGLEWDVVAAPGLVEGTFPAHSTRPRHDGQQWQLAAVTDGGWLTGYGSLPHALRGDADGLPDVRWSAIADQLGVEREVNDFKALGGAHELAEERRLAYVAVTRARRRLLLTTHVWSDGSTPRMPSRFVRELLDGPATVGRFGGPLLPLPPEGSENPRTATPRSVGWPTDPLGDRRCDVEAGAARVTAALARQLADSQAAAEATELQAAVGHLAGAAEPVAAQSVAPQPAASQPVASQAVASRPVAAEPDATEPDATEPVAAEPVAAEPVAASPVAAQPGAAQPGAAQSGAAQSVVAQRLRAQRWAWEVDVLLAERDRGRDRHVTASLPSHLSASRLVQLAADPVALALDVRRPMPREPVPAVRRGTAFHAWVERRLGVTAMVDVTDLPGAADDGAADDADLAVLQRHWLDSEWAERRVIAVEAAIETPVDGTVVRGRVDAVMARADGGVDVVDWKTGRPPSGREADARAVQLAAYRLAWSRLHGIALEQVGAAFFYAATGLTVRPVDLLDEAGLVRLLRGVDQVGAATA